MATETIRPNSLNSSPRSLKWLGTRSIVKRYFWPITRLVTVGLCVISVAAFLGDHHWFVDLLSHFRWFYMMGAIGLTAIGAFGKKRLVIATAMAACLINASQMLPYWMPTTTSESGAATSSLRLMAANVWVANRNPQRLFEAIQEVNADILVLCEMNASNQRTFQAVRNEYPYVTQHANARMFIFSRIPFESSRYVDHKIGTFPQPMATFQVDGKEFAVVGIHTSTALSHIGWKQRNLELTRTADLVRQLDTPAIVTGDMNVSSFSANFQNFLVAGGLVDGRIGQGLYATWPVFIPFVQIPIDHFVATPDVQVTRFANGSYTGSDHRPIVIDFNLTIEP